MIIKLPIIINNKVVNSLFKLKKYDNYFILSLLENIYNNNLLNYDLLSSEKINMVDKNPTGISLIKILTCNNINGITYINLYFPLKLYIIDKSVLLIYFFIINLTSNFKNKLDFFYNLNNVLISKYNLSFINFNNYDEYQNDIFSIINEQYLFLINTKKFNKEFWEMINLLINCSGFILWLSNPNNIKNN